jgi:Periplasmic binding protein domain
MLDNAISAKPSVIAVAADDPAAIVPVLKKAKAAGSHVMTWDGDADFRECFVNFVNYDAFGAALVEEMVKQVGQTADVAVVTSTLTAPNQTAWLAAMRKTIADKHPGMGACAWTSRCSSPAGSSHPAPTLILGESSWNSLLVTSSFSAAQSCLCMRTNLRVHCGPMRFRSGWGPTSGLTPITGFDWVLTGSLCAGTNPSSCSATVQGS